MNIDIIFYNLKFIVFIIYIVLFIISKSLYYLLLLFI